MSQSLSVSNSSLFYQFRCQPLCLSSPSYIQLRGQRRSVSALRRKTSECEEYNCSNFKVLCNHTISSDRTEPNVSTSSEPGLDVQTLRRFPREKLNGETVLVRFDANLLLKLHSFNSEQASKTISTIRYLHNAGAKIFLASNWNPCDNFNLLGKSVTDHLSSILKLKVMSRNVTSCSRQESMETWEGVDIFLLENLTQHKQESANCPNFAKYLSTGVSVFVNDTFSLSHKVLASTVGIARFCDMAIAGFHFEKELGQLMKITEITRHPYIAVIGGGNFSEKEVALCILASKCDGLVFVGNLAFQINHALGLPVPHRLLEHNGQNHFIQKVLGLVQLARDRNVPIFTPMDFLCKNDSDPQLLDIFHINKILNGWTPIDLGPATLKEFSRLLSKCQKILWIGPVKFGRLTTETSGSFELALFLKGMSRTGCDITIVGNAACSSFAKIGGFGSCKHFENASTVWDFLKGRTLPGVAALDRAYPFYLAWDSIFHDPTQPLVVDIGSGNGIFLLEMAQKWFGVNFLGLEINKKLVNRCLEKVSKSSLQNVYFLSTNATHTFRTIISSYPGKVVLVSIQCPNPDFNKEDHRWRMVQRSLIEAVTDLLAINGKVFLQSDVKEVAIRMKKQFIMYGKDLVIVGDGGQWLKDNPFGVRSDWERHVLDRGDLMYRIMMKKISNTKNENSDLCTIF